MSPRNYTDLTTTQLWKQYNQPHTINKKMWTNTIKLGFIIYLFFIGYISIQIHTISLLTITLAFAGAGAIMIGLSLSLGGLSHYFHSLVNKVAYRKHIGLVGYFFALMHAILLLFLNPGKYFYGFFDNLLTPDFILGLSAMSILTMMAAISNTWAMKLLGMSLWRFGLRLGYLAYLLLILRAIAIDHQRWTAWFELPNTLPPFRLVISIFAASVLLFRLFNAIKPRMQSH